MATERVIDLAGGRYADREYLGALPEPVADAEARTEHRREEALKRLRRRVRETIPGSRVWLDRCDLLDLLLILGVNDW